MISNVRPEHHAALLSLNARFVHWLSPLNTVGLAELLGRCDYARQIGGEAFLLGYRGDGPYRHKNVDWLSDRLDGPYAYVDRVIVAPEAAGQGHARALYRDFAAWAAGQGITTTACEVNTRPANPASHAFHATLGFTPLGEAEYGDLAVRYYAKRITLPAG